jgi:hypothetical protein
MLLAAPPALAETPGVVTIGVRQDARPFAWQADDSPGTFRGYLVDICTDAATRAGFRFRLVPVDATTRERILEDGAFSVPADDGPLALDLLCDPTTITLARLETFAKHPETEHAVFAPIVFVANGTYVRHGTKANQAACVVGTTDAPGAPIHPACWTRASPDGVRQVVLPDRISCSGRPAGADPAAPDQYLIAASLVGSTAEAAIDRAVRTNQLGLGANQRVCVVSVRDHRTGVRSFCRNDFHLYFGDFDIIQAYRALAAQEGVACDLARTERPLSYEPYALLVPSRNAEFRAKLVAAVYEIFSDGTAASRFDAHFPGHGKSSALELLYRINSIPGLRSLQREPQGAGGGEGGERDGEERQPAGQQKGLSGVPSPGGDADGGGAEDQRRQVERQHEQRQEQAAAADADG